MSVAETLRRRSHVGCVDLKTSNNGCSDSPGKFCAIRAYLAQGVCQYHSDLPGSESLPTNANLVHGSGLN